MKLQKSSSGFIQNIVWAAGAQDEADALRQRIQFHTQKIYLIIEPVTLKLLTTIDAKMDDLLDLMMKYFEVPVTLEPIPGWLDSRFQALLMKDPPCLISDIQHIPLREGFGALYGHYRQSTVTFHDRETGFQTAEQ